MSPAEPKIGSGVIAGREFFICDNLIDPETIADVAAYLNKLTYQRVEKSRPDTPVSGASYEIPDAVILAPGGFFERIKAIAEEFFPQDKMRKLRAYVNSTVYGDMYYTHRDCEPGLKDITILYYANPHWDKEWGGETVYFDENYDAQAVISIRPGRLLIARGAILHRGGVPNPICREERRTIAYKLAVD